MSKFVDIAAIMQVIGAVYNNPSILDNTDKYIITDDDFPDAFHKTVFGAIYNIYTAGVNKITLKNILDFLAQYPKSEALFKKEKGEEWLAQVIENVTPNAFDFYYNRMKKMTLLRAFDNYGVDVTGLYDPDNIFDGKKREIQEEWLNNTSLSDIANKVTERLDKIVATYVNHTFGETHEAMEDVESLLDRLKQHPDVGVPLYGPLINSVTRGARLRKLYLRSAPSGYGKTRAMIADACYIGCDEIYDDMFGWIKNGTAEPTVYITTEQELEEIQTLMLAFISGVDEDHILNNRYVGDEEERILHAVEVLKRGKVYVVELPDFSLRDVENIIKQNIRERGVKYAFFDYMMSSLKILEEIAGRAGGVKLREDHILFMMSRRLKDIANEYGVFVLSSTQLSADWRDSETPDQNLLRGAKSIADSIDYGSHLLPVTTKDMDNLQTILSANTFEKPNVKISVYKNRRGRYKGIYLWTKADYGTCRFKPMFATTWDYEILPMESLVIITDEPGAF